MEIELCGYKVLIDDEDYEKVKDRKWRLLKNSEKCIYFVNQRYDAENYRKTGSHSCSFYLHREIIGAVKGDGKIVDHINGDTLDCRKSNLRFVTFAQNLQNSKKHTNNKCGYKGVAKTSKNRWRAAININNKRIWLGSFESPELAHKAYCEASKKYHGEYGRIE